MEINKRSVVRIRPTPAFSVDAEALNNEASAHAYNPKGRGKKVHKRLDFITQSVKLYIMKHSQTGDRKVKKQLKKSPEVKAVRELAGAKAGYMVLLKNGEQYLVHAGANCFHPLRRWLKKHTSIKLKF